MEFTAPAKVNLFLNILSRREDGYHEIETLFEKISISDRISVETASSGTRISCTDPQVPVGGGSLMMRTVEAFNRKAHSDFCFKVEIEKNIPVGAGLGGGSSDAAALLKAMNEMTGYPLDRASLMEVAGLLGADVPVFISEASFAFGKGRGDIIEEVDADLEIWHVMVNPPFEMSTKAAYERVSDFPLTKKKGADKMFTAFLQEKDVRGIVANLRNDLQENALRKFPVLCQVFSELEKAGAEAVLLSGSGPTVFGIFQKTKAEKACCELSRVFPPEDDWKVWADRTYSSIREHA